jgi:predicted enzyme related to lactoylglutathione lyase
MRTPASASRFSAVGAALVIAGLVAGCSARATYELPPMTPAPIAVSQPGRFVWFDLVTGDPEAAKTFYGGLFGWEFSDESEAAVEYSIITHRGAPIGGLATIEIEESKDVVESDDENEESEEAEVEVETVVRGPAAWLVTMAVPDLDAQLRPLFREGGILHFGPLQVQGRGRMAIASDPGGAMIALVQPVDGAPSESGLEPGRWLWVELWAEKPKDAIEFYDGWVGYRAVSVKGSQAPSYDTFFKGRTPRAGLAEIPIREVKPNWLPYVQVSDVDETITRAQQLGARLFARDDDAAILIDPLGAAIGIQEWHGGSVP